MSVNAAAEVTITRLADGDESAYATFLKSMDEALLYYSLPFKRFLEDLLDCGAEHWLSWQNGRITGVLPLMEKAGPWGRVLNSLPFYGSNGGALAASAAAEKTLAEHYNLLAQAQGVAAATWISHPWKEPRHAHVIHNLDDHRIAQITYLSDQTTPLEKMLESSARRNIRKAESSGVGVRVDNERLAFLERVHRENMAEIGGKAKSPEFFAKLPLHFAAGRDYAIYVAEREGKAIAALLLFYFHHTVEYYIPVTVGAEREHQPMALILWTAMNEAAVRGYRYWNWGGTWESQQGVYRFKRKWGARDYAYRYFIQLNVADIMTRRQEEILASYPDFYVVPFSLLKTQVSKVK